MQLRDYQKQGQRDIHNAWNSGHRNVLYVLPTGGGKTFLFSSIVHEFRGEIVIIAHRETIISQISLSLCEFDVTHRILAPDKIIKDISSVHIDKFKKSFVDPLSIVTVGAVDTMVRRIGRVEFQMWAKKVKLWVQDECHHCLKKNKWGKVLNCFPNSLGLGVTATPTRTDGYGLSASTDGVFDTMIEGPTMGKLIKQKYLTPYKIYCPPSNLDVSNVEITKTGEFNKKQLNTATMDSTITSDVVIQYSKYAYGLKGLTFCPSIELAIAVTKKYNMAGVPAELITADTKQRRKIIELLIDGKIKQIVSVDTLGEGMDVPGVEVCSFLRKTESLGLYIQQFGRGMRPASGKTHVIILDHVGNVLRHNLPDIDRIWTMHRKVKTTGDESLLLTVCLGCYQVFEKCLSICPYCRKEYIENKYKNGDEKERSSPGKVNGDLTQIDDETLLDMRAAIYLVDNPFKPSLNHSEIIKRSILKRQREKKISQNALRNLISQWAGNLKYQGKNNSEIYKIFFQKTGFDIMTAQTLSTKKALAIMDILK